MKSITMGTGELRTHPWDGSRALQGECLVTVLHNSLWLCIVLSVCLMAWNPVVSFARNVMDNLILLGINCDADYTRRYTGHGWCVVCVGVTWCQGLSLGREGAPQFVPNFVTGADCGLTLIIWISEETCWRVVKQAGKSVTKCPRL